MPFEDVQQIAGKVLRFAVENAADMAAAGDNPAKTKVLVDIIVDEADKRIVLEEPWDSLADMGVRTAMTQAVENIVNAGWPEGVA